VRNSYQASSYPNRLKILEDQFLSMHLEPTLALE